MRFHIHNSECYQIFKILKIEDSEISGSRGYKILDFQKIRFLKNLELSISIF